jgi:hypothetical protein
VDTVTNASAEPNGYLVANPSLRAGIGTRLLHLAETTLLARALGREVIVDWRRTPFLQNRSLNYFTEFFVPAPKILGVPVHYVPSPSTDEYEAMPRKRPVLTDRAIVERLAAEPGAGPRYLVVRKMPPLPRLPGYTRRTYDQSLRTFYEELALRPEPAAELKEWYDANLRGHVVVGLNVAHGNGLFEPGRRFASRVNVLLFAEEERFLGLLETASNRASEGFPSAERDRYRIFYATDSAEMSELLRRLPRTVTRRTVFPPPGAGHQFSAYGQLGYTDHQAAADTIIDMLLLGRCNALVMNKSRFSRYALVTTDSFGGNVCDFEELAGASTSP